MKHVKPGLILLLIALGVAASQAVAADPTDASKAIATPAAKGPDVSQPSQPMIEKEGPPSVAQKELADSLIEAIKSKDAAKMKALIAPKSLQCFDKSRHAFLDHWLERQFRLQPGNDQRIAVAKLLPGFAKDSARATYPLVPTDTLIVFTAGAAGGPRTIHRMMVQQDNRWYLVLACPTAATIEQFNKTQQTRVEAKERADKLLPQVKEPLTSEVRALVAKGDRRGASKLVAEKLHTDLLAARYVVDRVGGRAVQ